MLKKRLKFSIISLAELEETIRFQLEASEHIEETNWEESLETYLLHQVWSFLLKLIQISTPIFQCLVYCLNLHGK